MSGPGEVFELIRHGRARTRGDVLEVTGLSRMTVAQRVDALLTAGLVVEGSVAASTGGRRPRQLRVNVRHAFVLVATVDTTHTRVALTDLAGRVLAEEHLDVAVADGPSSTLDALGECARLLVARQDAGAGSLCGIVIDGSVYRGTDGGAGDIGHVRLRHDGAGNGADGGTDGGAICQCGAVGCLAAVASGRAVARRLSSLGVPAASGRDVRELLAAGHGDAARLTQEAGRLIGEVMATVVCVLNPEVVVVHGDLASAPLLAGLRETLYRLSLPRATRHLTLQLGVVGDDAPLVGLTRMVVDREFSAGTVNARLG